MSQAEPVTTRPSSIAELRAVTQPPEVRGRRNAEHWTASLYLRDLSPYLTWMLLKTRISANGVTGLMILVGWSTAAALLIPGIWGALLAVVLGQLQMLVDCCDGEVARWRRTSSPAGVFLDKVGHYSTEALIPLALGIRAAAYPLEFPADFLWTTLAALLALVIVLNKALNDMVHVARANAGLPKLADTHGETAPRGGLVATLRKAARFLPFHRLYHSVELTLIAFAAAVIGLFAGQPFADRLVVAVLLPLAVLAVFGHFVAIMASTSCPSLSDVPRVGVVVLTMGTRPDDLARGIRSVLAQRGVEIDVVCVGNGWDPATAEPPLPAGVKTLHLPENLGIPAGRNRGVPRSTGECSSSSTTTRILPSDAFLADGCRMLAARPEHRPDPAAGRRPDRPRRRRAAGSRASARATPRTRATCSRAGRAPCCCRAPVFDATGGWADPFFYAHEGIELAWRVWDTGHVRVVRGRPRGGASGHRPDPARLLLPAERPQPGLARATQPARPCSCRSTSARGPAIQVLRWARNPRR